MTLLWSSLPQEPPNGAPTFWRRLVFHLLLASVTTFVIFFANDLTIQDWAAMAYPFLIVLCALSPLALQIWRVAPKPKSRLLAWLALASSVAAIGAAFLAEKFVVLYQAIVAISLPFGLGFAALALVVAWKEHTKHIRFYSSRTHSFQVLPP